MEAQDRGCKDMSGERYQDGIIPIDPTVQRQVSRDYLRNHFITIKTMYDLNKDKSHKRCVTSLTILNSCSKGFKYDGFQDNFAETSPQSSPVRLQNNLFPLSFRLSHNQKSPTSQNN